MITKFYTTSFTVTGQIWVGDKSTHSAKASFNGHIQQSTDKDYIESLGLKFSKSFKVWCPIDTDISESDKINDGSNNYDVKFIIKRITGVNKHLNLIVEKR